MGWVKLDDEFPDHPKVDAVSDGAFRLHVAGLCYAAHKLTDGLVPKGRLSRLVPRFRSKQADELVDAGLWHRTGHACDRCEQPPADHYVIHDYLEWNRPADEELERKRKRAEAGRIGGRRSGAVRRSKAEAMFEANGEASASAVAEANTKQKRTPSPSPYRQSPPVDDLREISSSSSGDDDAENKLREAYELVAERRLEQRNREVEARGGDPIRGTARRRAWIHEDIARTEQHLGLVARTYLAEDPTMSPGQLADALDPTGMTLR